MEEQPADVRWSVSTWQQPLPSSVSRDRDALLRRIADHVTGLSAGRLRVAVDGRTAAGKTTFGHELALRITQKGRPALRACLDDFKRPWRDRHLYDRVSGEGYYRNAFDYDTVVDLLLDPSLPGGSGECALCSIDPLTQEDHSQVITHAANDAVLVVDGVFAFRPELNPYWDARLWIDVDAETSVRRGAERDQDWAGSEAERIHRERYLPAEEIYLDEVDPVSLADFVIDNSRFDRPVITQCRDGSGHGA
jgi:uridine kinase